MNLTDEQKTALDVGLATREGWTDVKQLSDKEDRLLVGVHPPIKNWHNDGRDYAFQGLGPLPEYTRDLNAINRLEERLTDEQHKRYRIILWQLTTDGPNDGYEHVTDKQRRAFVSAPASQRAIAMARALNLNIEGVTL